MTQPSQPTDRFGQPYMNLTTFRTNEQPVTTPVWVASAYGKLYIYTGASTGKIKRIRLNSAVEVAPSNASGKPRGAIARGRARILAGQEAERADALLQQKYGWQKRLMVALNSVRRKIGAPIFVEIVLEPEGAIPPPPLGE